MSKPAAPTPYAWTVLALMVATTAFNVADRNLMNILIPPIQQEFGATDAQMGLLVGVAFAVIHNVANLPIAFFADRGPRSLLIAAGLFLWSGLTALSGFAQSFFQLLLARMDADFRGFVAYAAVDCGGDIVLSRSAIALRSLVLWRAWDVTPMPKRHFVRFLTDYTRHCLSRPLNLGQVDLSLAHARRAG